MKNFSKSFGFIALAAVIALVFTGCGPTVESVSMSGGDSIVAGDSLKFTATVVGKNKPSQSVVWSVSSKSDGSGDVANGTDISPNGVLVVDEKETATTLYVKAVSVLSADKFDYKPVKVEKPAATTTKTTTAAQPAATVTKVTITADDQTRSTQGKRTVAFSAKVEGTNNPGQGVTWKVVKNLDGTGTLDSGTKIENGLLSVDVSKGKESGEVYVIATSKVDTKVYGTYKIENVERIGSGGGGQGGGNRGGGNRGGNNQSDDTTTTAGTETGTDAGTTVTVTKVFTSPVGRVVVKKGESRKFTATVEGDGNPSQEVTWKVSSNNEIASGTVITADGTLTVDENQKGNRLTIRATSKLDSSKFEDRFISIE